MKSPCRIALWSFSVLCVPLLATSQVESLNLRVTKQFDEPILTINSAAARGNKYGFEGGRVLKLNGTYHLFTSEMVGDPHWVKMKLAHWTSRPLALETRFYAL